MASHLQVIRQTIPIHSFTMYLLSVECVLCAVRGVGETRATKTQADGLSGGGRKGRVHDRNAGGAHTAATESSHWRVTALCSFFCFDSLLVR